MAKSTNCHAFFVYLQYACSPLRAKSAQLMKLRRHIEQLKPWTNQFQITQKVKSALSHTIVN